MKLLIYMLFLSYSLKWIHKTLFFRNAILYFCAVHKEEINIKLWNGQTWENVFTYCKHIRALGNLTLNMNVLIQWKGITLQFLTGCCVKLECNEVEKKSVCLTLTMCMTFITLGINLQIVLHTHSVGGMEQHSHCNATKTYFLYKNV